MFPCSALELTDLWLMRLPTHISVSGIAWDEREDSGGPIGTNTAKRYSIDQELVKILCNMQPHTRLHRVCGRWAWDVKTSGPVHNKVCK